MKRQLALAFSLAIVIMVAIGIVRALVYTNVLPPTGPVYSLTQVEAGLAQYPRAWVGRTVLVRALLQYEPCPYRVANGNVGHTFFDRYECYLAPAWVAERLHSHKTFVFPPPFRLAANPPKTPSFFLHRLPLLGRFVPLPRLDEVDGPLDTTPRVYLILLVPPSDCNMRTTGGLTSCPRAMLIGRVP